MGIACFRMRPRLHHQHDGGTEIRWYLQPQLSQCRQLARGDTELIRWRGGAQIGHLRFALKAQMLG